MIHFVRLWQRITQYLRFENDVNVIRGKNLSSFKSNLFEGQLFRYPKLLQPVYSLPNKLLSFGLKMGTLNRGSV